MALEDIRQGRIDKIGLLREAGVQPYPERFDRTHTLAEAAGLTEGTQHVALAGRVRSKNKHGKLTFAWLHDVAGAMQVALQKNVVGDEAYDLFHKTVDVGDFVGAVGEIFRTKKGELTLRAERWVFLGKSLLPMPEKWGGVKDDELRYRQRYLDLISSDETKQRFLLRSKVVAAMRRFLDDHDFVEVDTPVLCDKPSGALARPFHSHHNALDIPVVMRIAPETYLKRCVVGGFDRVYEFARCFRNEGIDASHLQDFTMLEFYAAYWNYEVNMAFTERMVEAVTTAALGSPTLTLERDGETHEVSFAGPYPRVSMIELIERDCGIDVRQFRGEGGADGLRAAIAGKGGLGIDPAEIANLGTGNLIDALYKKVSRPKLIQPTFLTGHPLELSPLARRNDDDPGITDRFQLVVGGWEVVNAYSELVDPLDQRERLESQARARAAGDEEAMPVDEDYLLAMEHGMPPISGWGMGIDRFTALLTGVANLRDVVLFPLMRPRAKPVTEHDVGVAPGGATLHFTVHPGEKRTDVSYRLEVDGETRQQVKTGKWKQLAKLDGWGEDEAVDPDKLTAAVLAILRQAYGEDCSALFSNHAELEVGADGVIGLRAKGEDLQCAITPREPRGPVVPQTVTLRQGDEVLEARTVGSLGDVFGLRDWINARGISSAAIGFLSTECFDRLAGRR